ncbi:MAG: GAF domain-containing protein [Chloroflexi bacterium]|nr:GAF domain-containing protein [Chloroflexota bacterium]
MTTPSAEPGQAVQRFKGRLGRNVLYVLLPLTILPLLILGAISYLRARTLLFDQTSAHLVSISNLQLEQLSQAIRIQEIQLESITTRPDFSYAIEALFHTFVGSTSFDSARQTAISVLDQVNSQSDPPVFDDFLVVDSQGLIRLSTHPDWEGLDLSTEPHYTEFITPGNRTLALYDLEVLLPDETIIVSSSTHHRTGGQVDWVLLGVNRSARAAAILALLSETNPEAYAYFITEDEYFIGPDPTGDLSIFVPSGDQIEYIRRFFQEETGRESGLLEIENASLLPVVTQAFYIPALSIGVAIEIPEGVVFGDLNSLAPFTLTLITIVVIIVALAIYIMTRRLSRPILSLAETTRRFSEGDFSQRSPVRRNDEVGLLSYSINQMADELNTLYRSLEQRVDEQTRKIRTASEVAQNITSTFNLGDLLDRTVSLITGRFDFYHAGIFLLDETRHFAVLRAASGPAAVEMMARQHRLAVGSPSIIGWVTANKEYRLAAHTGEDAIHLKNELLPDTLAEIGVPILLGDEALGALDVQSIHPDAFDPETVVLLQTLSSQIAAAIQNIRTLEATQVDIVQAAEVYRASYLITQSQTEEEALAAVTKVLEQAPYVSLLLLHEGDVLKVAAYSQSTLQSGSIESIRATGFPVPELSQVLVDEIVIGETDRLELPASLQQLARQLRLATIAVLPVRKGGTLSTLLVMGTREKRDLPVSLIRPYMTTAQMVTSTLDGLRAQQGIEQRVRELEAITATSQSLSSIRELPALYQALHEQVRQAAGDINFLVALYETGTNSIQIPYLYDNETGQVSALDSFPLGEGLTSILIRTRQPLMLVEDTEQRAIALGAKVVGSPARSWLGVPLIVGGDVVGAIIIQDTEREKAFDDGDLRFLTTLAAQVAGAIYNVRLLDETHRRALQLQTAAEIARDISGSLDLGELLSKAVNLIRERFDYYHSAIFLNDASGERAVIREATGEAGKQMKRAGHHLVVGSKSIIGYVTGSGEALIVNDTNRDATYFANPLLPDTRSEAGIPLKVGQRILGALDVQSTSLYAFNEESVGVLRILADQMAVAVINSELFAETQEHLAQHRLLHHVTTAAASGSTLEEALTSAVQGLQVTMGGDRVSILIANREKQVLEVKSAVGYGDALQGSEIPFGEGVTGWVAEHKKPVRLDDVSKDERYIAMAPDVTSELAIPMVYRGEILGVLNVESDLLSAYSENDEEMLGTLGGSLAAVIANARLLEQIRRQVDRERTLYDLTSKIRRSTDMETIMATTASELSKALGARRAQIKIAPPGVGPGKEMKNE